MTTSKDIEHEVLANVLAQPANLGTVADLNLPPDLLRRVADRAIGDSYFERFRAVIAQAGDSPPVASPPTEARMCPAHGYEVREITARRSLPEGRPALRAWRPDGDWPALPPADRAECAAMVNARLARDGLIAVTLQAMHELGLAQFLEGHEPALQSVGIPTDLLAHFRPADMPGEDPSRRTIAWLARTLQAAGHPARARASAAKLPFVFQPTLTGFSPWHDDGSRDAELVRLQLTRATDVFGEGDGSGFDMLRQFAHAEFPQKLAIHLHARDLPGTVEALARWKVHPGRVSLLVQQDPVSQWAQDNLKAGRVNGGLAALVPRFASRGEEASCFVPGDDVAAMAVGDMGVAVRRSSLHFQGGNILSATLPGHGHVLFIGESELARNTVLGLTPAQCERAFAAEFAANRVIVLPNASFHTDYEVSFRHTPDSLLAFVGDSVSAAEQVVRLCVTMLGERSAVPALDPRAVNAAISHRDATELLVSLQPIHAAAAVPGGYSFRFSGLLRRGGPESGIAALRLLLKAIDVLAARYRQGRTSAADQFTTAYLASIRRRDEDRAVLKAILAKVGCTLIEVPSLAEGPISLNYLNGVHLPQAVHMPSYGGIFLPADERAGRVFRSSMPGKPQVIPHLSGESQRRQGAIRCSLCCFPVSG